MQTEWSLPHLGVTQPRRRALSVTLQPANHSSQSALRCAAALCPAQGPPWSRWGRGYDYSLSFQGGGASENQVTERLQGREPRHGRVGLPRAYRASTA